MELALFAGLWIAYLVYLGFKNRTQLEGHLAFGWVALIISGIVGFLAAVTRRW